MQFDTLRLRLIKLAARIVELKTQMKIHLPSSAPDQAIFAMLLTACRVSSPESRGVMPRNRPPFFNPQRRPNPEKKQTRRRGRDPLMPAAQECNQNASALIYVLPMYFSHALIGLAACNDSEKLKRPALAKLYSPSM